VRFSIDWFENECALTGRGLARAVPSDTKTARVVLGDNLFYAEDVDRFLGAWWNVNCVKSNENRLSIDR